MSAIEGFRYPGWRAACEEDRFAATRTRARRPEYTLGNGARKGNRVAGNTTREELKERISRGKNFVLVEAPGEEYYRHSRLPGEINPPLEKMDRAEDALPDKHAQIVVYCMNTM